MPQFTHVTMPATPTGAIHQLLDETAPTGKTAELSELERRILDFESNGRWRSPGAKEAAIRVEFDSDFGDGLASGASRYYQILNRLIDDPVALRYNAVLVNRLRRLRDARRSARSTSPVAVSS